MPPRYVYWTILAGGLPTAFRAADREDLLPTFKRIRDKHPDAEMKYFAQGRLWDSPEAARAAREQKRRPPEPRGRDWRPGGEHRDPRQPFKDAKQARNRDWRQQRFERKQKPFFDTKERPPREKPHGDPLAEARAARGGGRSARPFARTRFERGQGTEEPRTPPRPPGPDREPRPDEVPKPTTPPRPGEPAVPPPGPPERGRGGKGRVGQGTPRFDQTKRRFGQRPPRGPGDRRRRS